MPDDRDQPALRFDNVSLWFDETPALDQVSFQVPTGQTAIVLGAASSGKSVLLKVALGLMKADSGSVFVFGEDISRMKEVDLFRIRQRIGVLFQEGALFDSLTIEDNVAYALRNNRADRLPEEQVRSMVEETLSFVELEGTLEKFPSQLSGGMRRRAGIARAVVSEPALVLYDSPTAGLDPITANTIITLIVKERDVKQTSSVIVTHRYQDGHLLANFRYNPQSGELEPSVGNAASSKNTKFLVMKSGRLVFEGNQRELESSPDPYVSKFVLRR